LNVCGCRRWKPGSRFFIRCRISAGLRCLVRKDSKPVAGAWTVTDVFRIGMNKKMLTFLKYFAKLNNLKTRSFWRRLGMMKKNIIRIGCALVFAGMVLPVFLQAQTPPENMFQLSKPDIRPVGFLNSFLDPSRFSMQHSYTLSFGRMGSQSMTQGLYLNTMNYQFSEPLTMQVRFGFLHQPFGAQNEFQGGTTGMNKVFLQRAMMKYQPTENLMIQIDFQQFPSSLFSPYPYRSW